MPHNNATGPPAVAAAIEGRNPECTANSSTQTDPSQGTSGDSGSTLDKSQTGSTPQPVQTADTDTELAVSRIVRPQLFHTPEVSGLLVPVVTISPVRMETTTTKKGTKVTTSGGKPEAKWRLYLHRSNGQRECCDLTAKLELAKSDPLWFSTLPSTPDRTVSPAWSAEGRKRFLDGHTPDVADLFRRLRNAFGRFIYLPDDEATGAIAVLVLWTMLTYAYPAWSAVPYLAVGGPLGSGKTRVFEVLNRVVYRPLPSANMTAPCMFRTLHDQGGTLLLDEAERLRSPEAGELRSILLSGYKAGNPAHRLERTGDEFRRVSFDVFGPKAIAAIASLPEALESRCIRLMMFRAPKDSPVPRLRIDENPSLWTGVRDDLHAFALTQGPKFVELAKRADLCDGFGGRDYELWQPLIALARIIEDAEELGLVEAVKDFARFTIESRVEDQTPEADEILLRHLADWVRAAVQCDRPAIQNRTPKELLAAVRASDPDAFRSWAPRGVGHALSRYGILSKRGTKGKRTYRDVTLEQLRRVERHYSLDLGLSNATNATNATGATPTAKNDGELASDGTSGQHESPPPNLSGESGESDGTPRVSRGGDATNTDGNPARKVDAGFLKVLASCTDAEGEVDYSDEGPLEKGDAA